jgi:hypothetical protein
LRKGEFRALTGPNYRRVHIAFSVLGWCAITPVSPAQSAYPLQSFSAIIESYFTANPAARGMVDRFTWSEFRGRVNDHWSAVFTEIQFPTFGELDDTYVQYEDDLDVVRAGRQRSGFGFGSWSDLYYNVVARLPLIRTQSILPDYSLLTFGSGARWTRTSGDWQVEGSVEDASLQSRQVLPVAASTVQFRLQRDLGPVLVGLNALDLTKSEDPGTYQAYGIDLRTGWQRFLLKAEALTSKSDDENPRGYYADLTYLTPFPIRTQLGARVESYGYSGSRSEQVTTLGVRVVPCPYLMLVLDRGWESGPALPTGEYGGYSSPAAI